jgi:hypothetical protein
MTLPKSITEAPDLYRCLTNLCQYIPAEVYKNHADAFYGILRRAHEIGWQQGSEMQKSLIRIRMGLDPISAFGSTIADYKE